MSRQYIGRNRLLKPPAFELTALIDVVFILVMFFAVSTTFTPIHQGVSVVLPSSVSSEAPSEAITISIDRNQRLYWNGTLLPESQLVQSVQHVLQKNPNQQVLLQADKHTPYSRVIWVLDAIRQAGCSRVMLETEPS